MQTTLLCCRTSHRPTGLSAACLLLLVAGAARAQTASQAEPDADPSQPAPVQPAQPPAPVLPPLTSPPGSTLTSIFGPQRPAFVRQRLTRVPDMFGDFVSTGYSMEGEEYDDPPPPPVVGIDADVDLPIMGPLARTKISDFNKALPVDRVFFFYNHFHNALRRSITTETVNGVFNSSRGRSLDRYTFGIEKTFFDGQSSIEMRLPLFGDTSFSHTPDPLVPTSTTGVSTGAVGNLALILKILLYGNDTTTFAAGLGFEAPTGNDTQVRVGSFRYTMENDAVHVHPWIGFLHSPEGLFFMNGFVQVDVPLNGNDVRQSNVSGTPFLMPNGPIGRLDDQTLLFIDIGSGLWLVGPRDSGTLRSLAAILELHYTTALKNTDRIAVTNTSVGGGTTEDIVLSNRRNRFDVVNLTTGFQAQLFEGTFVRIATSAPLRREDNRFFDAEVMFSIVQLY